jgi:glycyl-tRNA synthetase (class II)
MVKDTKTGQCHRADKLIDESITKILAKNKKMTEEEVAKLIRHQKDCDNYNA